LLGAKTEKFTALHCSSLTRLVMQIFQSFSALHHLTDVVLHDVNDLIHLILQSAANAITGLADQTSKFATIYFYSTPQTSGN